MLDVLGNPATLDESDDDGELFVAALFAMNSPFAF